jgi:hypothetical protein
MTCTIRVGTAEIQLILTLRERSNSTIRNKIQHLLLRIAIPSLR